jgi:hypothetical protein
LTVGHSSGGPAPTVVFVTIDVLGNITRHGSGPAVKGRVEPQLASRIITKLRSPEMQHHLATLRALKYQSGCCDTEDIFIDLDGVITEAPVREYTSEGPTLHERRVLPEELLDVLREIDSLSTTALGESYLPVTPK